MEDLVTNLNLDKLNIKDLTILLEVLNNINITNTNNNDNIEVI